MRTAFSLLLALLLVACGQTIKESRAASPSSAVSQQIEQQKMIDALQHIASGDARNDAQRAAQAKDWRLWAYQGRTGLHIPGVVAAENTAAVNIAPAMGDVIYSEQHLQARLQFLDYASLYNQYLLSLRPSGE